MPKQGSIPTQPQQPEPAPNAYQPDSQNYSEATAQIPEAQFDQTALFSQQPYQQPGQPPTPPNAQPLPEQSKGKGLAVGALVCGILAIVLSFTIGLGIILGIVAIVLAILAKHNAPDGKATAGLVCGILGIVFSILMTLLLFAGIAVMDSVLSEGDYGNSTDTIVENTGDIDSDSLTGSWELSSIEIEEEASWQGVTSSDLEILDYVGLEAIKLNLVEDGTFYLDFFNEASVTGTWEASEDGTITLHEKSGTSSDETLHYTVKDGQLTLQDEGVRIIFNKVSNTPATPSPESAENSQ